MNRLTTWIMGSFFRWFPHRAPTGLRAVGKPDENSPVLVTGNYSLTISRLLRALRGQNFWLLTAPSGGINVWCASCGGEFTEHQVIGAVKTSMLAEKVRHREIILPLLAAPGVDRKQIYEKTGFHAKFGPVRATDIPAYLAAGMKKEDRMNRIELGLKHRMDMLLSMNFVIWMPLALLFALFWPQHLLHLSLLFWGAAFLLYVVFPWIPGKTGWAKALVMVVVLWAGYLLVGGLQTGDWLVFWPWMTGGAGLILAIGFDLAGIVEAVPSDAEGLVRKMGFGRLGFLFREKAAGRITLDQERCKGCFACFEVCPVEVFERDVHSREVNLAHPEESFSCGACVRQCPEKALFFS